MSQASPIPTSLYGLHTCFGFIQVCNHHACPVNFPKLFYVTVFLNFKLHYSRERSDFQFFWHLLFCTVLDMRLCIQNISIKVWQLVSCQEKQGHNRPRSPLRAGQEHTDQTFQFTTSHQCDLNFLFYISILFNPNSIYKIIEEKMISRGRRRGSLG